MKLKTTMISVAMGLGFALSANAETLFLANADAIDSPMDRMNQHFAELVEDRSNGEIKVNYITGNQLGTPPQVMDQISAGSVDAMGTAASWLSSYAPDTQILTWGFTFRDGEHMFKFFKSDLFDELTADMQENDRIRVLSAGPAEPRIAYMVEPLAQSGSFDGRKMRIPQIQSYLALWSALGAQPTQIAWGEVFLGLKTGVIDGAEGPPTSAISQRFHEAAPNIYLTNHVWAATTIVINEDKFSSLSAAHQAIVSQAAEDSAVWAYDDATSRREEVLDTMRAGGATVNAYDSTQLQESARTAVSELEDEGLWRKGLYDAVTAIQ